jgi:hypothetical protein
MLTVMRVHTSDDTRDALVTVVDASTADLWDAVMDGRKGQFAAVPPAGSDWERAEWDDLAHRAGVA